LVKDLFNSRKRRDRLSIIAEILEIARKGVLKTKIMYQANLSFAQLNDYISLLLDLNLLKTLKVSERNIYETTDKGSRFLQRFGEIREIMVKESDVKNGNSLHLVKRGTRVVSL